jgi:hypothetical protein
MKQDNLNLVRDEKERVRAINHNQAPVTLAAATPRELAQAYLREVADVYDINTDQMGTLDLELRGDLDLDETASFRLEQEKQAADNTVVSYTQTYFSLPVRQAGIDVVMQNNPLRVLSSSASFYHAIEVKRPDPDRLDRFRELSAEDLAKLLRSDNEPGTLREIKINQKRFVVYKYDAKNRQFIDTDGKRAFEPLPTLPLPKVPDSIVDGHFYVTLETYFTMPLEGLGSLNWLALIEVETGAILYLTALIAHAQGYVFLNDPVAESGNTANTPSSTNATLNPFRDDVTLQGLNPPAVGVQSLSGDLINISSTLATPPTTTTPFNFYYNVRTNNFSAVNAYYNCDRFFRLITDFDISLSMYMDGTSFPIPVNHRWGSSVNANCAGDATGDGIGGVNFELADSSDTTTNPIGSACDWTVVLHEIGGHGILYDHIQNGQWWLGFSHSQGDSFAAILNDPESALTGVDRFVTFPFCRFWDEDIVVRRHDRSVAAGWGWGGANDNNFTSGYHGYKSEQILSTTLFRLYRSMGGDAADVNQKRFASRFACYLILKTVGLLTSTSPAAINKTSQTDYVPVTDYESKMESADLANFTPINPPETNTGGAYLKVIRWAFEKQGLFRAAGASLTTEGSPPPVDVYINDGRNGEYQYIANHWSCQDIWNRTGTTGGDGGGIHQEPIVGETNRAFVRIKNRGSQIATNVVVKGYHCNPGVGLTYPVDWTPMTDASLSAPDIAANDNVGIVVGPFRWIPSQLEHECMFFSVSADNDLSNIEVRITGSIPEWRLVPHDNNIAQRNVAPVAGGGGAPGLKASFQRRPFSLKNTFSNEAEIKLVPTLPKFLTKLGWKLEFVNSEGGNFRLMPGKRTEILLSMQAGEDFSRELVKNNAEDSLITVTAYANGIIIGGMSYHVDPNIEMPGERPKVECPESRHGILKRIWLCLKRFFHKLFKRQ